MDWILELDTNIANEPAQYRGSPSDRYGVTGRSLALFIANRVNA
jgi:hypothetical protein